MSTVLVIDDDRIVRCFVQEAFKSGAIQVAVATTAAEGISALAREKPDVVLLDVMLPQSSGLEVFERIRSFDPKLPVIFITASEDTSIAIEAIKEGAYDYLYKPLDIAQIQGLVEKALETRRLMNVPVVMPMPTVDVGTADALVGNGPQMLAIYKSVGRVASQNVTVLIEGESGTGKELIARAIYQHSQRARAPFLAVNCAAIHETLLESELFGHEKGSFTGADQRRIGKFEHCSGGTLFMDEVGDMSPLVQSKLLRVLQEQQFERVGGNVTIKTDTRVIAATNRDLKQMVADGKFREDLYYRLNGFAIQLPPLRERERDVPLLLDYFFSRYSREMDRDVRNISPEALAVLLNYSWPGNVRELQNVVRQTLLLTTGPVVLPEFLPRNVRGETQRRGDQPLPDGGRAEDLAAFIEERLAAGSEDIYGETLSLMEQVLVTRMLTETDGNRSAAAKRLGITRASLLRKIKSLRISLDHVVHIAPDDETELVE